jgi:hypothetical protein
MSNAAQPPLSISQSNPDEANKIPTSTADSQANKPIENELALPESEPWIRPEVEEYFSYEI